MGSEDEMAAASQPWPGLKAHSSGADMAEAVDADSEDEHAAVDSEEELPDDELELLAQERSAVFDDIEAHEDRLAMESKKVSSQFQRLEVLLQAAQMREEAEEKEEIVAEEELGRSRRGTVRLN